MLRIAEIRANRRRPSELKRETFAKASAKKAKVNEAKVLTRPKNMSKKDLEAALKLLLGDQS